MIAGAVAEALQVVRPPFRTAGGWIVSRSSPWADFAAAAAALSLALAVGWLLGLVAPRFLRAVFAPLVGRDERRHRKGLLILAEVTAALAAGLLAIWFATK